MWLLDWYRELREIRTCQNCDYLKTQIEIERQFNKVLFDKLTNKPTDIPTPVQPVPDMIKPKFVPWRVRREMLENEDRRSAQVLKQRESELNRVQSDPIASKDDPDVIALEKEIGLIEKERENAGKIR
jgi:hypothetical protein